MPDASAVPPAVDLQGYAEVIGRTWLRGEEALGRELAARHVSAEAWQEAHGVWSQVIDEELARGGTTLVLTFAATFEVSRREDVPEVPAPSRDGGDADEAAVVTPVVVRQDVPSYLQAKVVPASPPATAELDLDKVRDLVAAGAMPFSGRTSPEQLEKLRTAATDDEARFQELASGGPDPDETVMFQPTTAERAELRTLPFEGARGQSDAVEMDVDQYAAFAAQLEVKGPSSSVLERHGVTSPKSLLALHAEQERRFSADPTLRARFEERKAHFMAFLKGGRP